MKKTLFLAFVLAGLMAFAAGCSNDTGLQAEKGSYVTSDVYFVDAQGAGARVGSITFMNVQDDMLEIKTDLKGLPPGKHGMHIHEVADCGPKSLDGKTTGPALAAGGHYDPAHTGKHMGPGGQGHRGDLPVLTVAADGTAKIVTVVPGLRVSELKDRSVIIHAGADNYSDQPQALGGGGARIACGVIK